MFTDWKQINDPAFKLYAFQSQSDGEFTNYILIPDWKPFKIDNVDTTCNGTQVPMGTAPGLFVKGVCYSATFDTETDKFIGYMNGSVKKDISYVTLTDNGPIYLYKHDMRYPCGPHPTYKAKSYKYAFDNKENIDYNNKKEIEFISG